MYITSVEISNFRSFQGYHEFDFRFQEKSNLNVIFGKNGAGKSIFADAIYWCLYGKEFLNFPTQPLYNYNSFKELDVDKELSVIVDCKFEDNGEIFEVKRELSFIKNYNNKPISVNPNLNIFIHSMDGNVECIDGQFFDKFPEFLFSFLFYDDESSNFFEEQYNFDFKKFIYKFHMIDVVDTTNYHINSLLNHYIKEIRKMGSEGNDLAMLLNQEENLIKNIEETKKEMNHVKYEMQNLIDEQYKITDEISSYSKEANDLFKRREILSHELNKLENWIRDFEINKQKILFKSFPSAVLFSRCENSNELVNFLNDNNVNNSDFYQRYYQIKRAYLDLNVIENIRKKHDVSIKIKNDYCIKRDKLEEINSFLSAIDDSEINKAISKKHQIEKGIMMLERELGILKNKEDSLNKSLKHNTNLMEKGYELQFSQNIIHRRIDFCKNAQIFGQQLEKELFKHIISEIESYCNHILYHHFGMGKFRKIILNDSFDIKIVNHSNQLLSINDLSFGEKKLLRLSLIFSISRCLGLKFPIILMDPFSKLDIGKVRLLVNFIFEELDNQTILILNNNQYDEYIPEFFKNNVVAHQLIKNQGNVEVSSHEN